MSGRKTYAVSKLQQANEKTKDANADNHRFRHGINFDRSLVPAQKADDAWVNGLLKGKIVEGTENYPDEYLSRSYKK